MMELNIAQVIGLIGFITGFTALLHTKDQNLRLQIALYTCIMTVHFFMLGAMTAAIASAVSCARSYLSTRTRSAWVMWFFIALMWGLGVPNIRQPFEIITIVGASVATYGMFKKQGVTLRLMLTFNTVCWVTNNVLIGSLGGSLSEGSFLVVNLYMIWKLCREKPKEAAPDTRGVL